MAILISVHWQNIEKMAGHKFRYFWKQLDTREFCLEAGEIVQSLKFLCHKHEGMSSIQHPCKNSECGSMHLESYCWKERNRRIFGAQWSLRQAYFQANERFCFPRQSKRHLMSDTWSWLLALTCIHACANLYEYAHIYTQIKSCLIF